MAYTPSPQFCPYPGTPWAAPFEENPDPRFCPPPPGMSYGPYGPFYPHSGMPLGGYYYAGPPYPGAPFCPPGAPRENPENGKADPAAAASGAPPFYGASYQKGKTHQQHYDHDHHECDHEDHEHHHMEERCAQLIDMYNDFMQGKTNPAKVVNFLSGTGTHFWKGAIVGAVLTLILTNNSIKSSLSEGLSGIFKKFNSDNQGTPE